MAKNTVRSCPFNDGVDCDSYACGNCGWRKEITDRRVEMLRARFEPAQEPEPSATKKSRKRAAVVD